jgi:transposase InsO family protein
MLNPSGIGQWSWFVPCDERLSKVRNQDQLWVADITYIRMSEAFVYLAVVLDGFSRRVVGWAMAVSRDNLDEKERQSG